MRHWHLPDTHNVRDLGGYARANAAPTQWRRIFRADNLHHLDAASRQALREAGLSLVVDLRNARETEAEPNPFADAPGTAYRNVSLFEALAPIAMLGSPFDMGQRYRDALDRCGQPIVEVLTALAEAPDGIVVFHCTAGKDRTGIIAALILALAGVSDDDIAADYAMTAQAAPLLARLRARSMALGADPEHVERVLASEAGTMAGTLRYLRERHGGAAAYLERNGLAADVAERLVERLCR